ncbi:tRNA-splicing endonuclease subunit Sen34 [Orussus abietinus]|uniref:tRNA-splicing endonuclease subunit Sen34 n=1 Tax=Orussus abietinus TaxID=222816 RepID=UPI0006264CDF|nr:tRNA-splicing endonuclease subunit Sen34 [Orussus abietinus]
MTNMIDLVFSNAAGSAFVWNAEDWFILRKEHRIIGELVGCNPKLPRQEILLGLPLLLLPEEVTVLLEQKVARLVHYPCLQQIPSESLKKAFEDYRQELFVEQEKCLREQRKQQVTLMLDRIVAGKRRKLLGIGSCKKKMKKPLTPEMEIESKKIEINYEEVVSEEMDKLPKLEKKDALVQTHTAYPWLMEDDIKLADWKYPLTTKEILRYKVFKDLWEQGFYVTGGEKFGGDFLVYSGDPIMFHSQFIIQCRDRDDEIAVSELIGECRIGCHVRKTEVYASFASDKETIMYQSIQWSESSAFQR